MRQPLFIIFRYVAGQLCDSKSPPFGGDLEGAMSLADLFIPCFANDLL